MALKAIITAEEFGKLGDGLKGEYKSHKVGDKDVYMLDVSGVDGYELDDVRGLKTALGAERTAKTNVEKMLEKFKDIDPEAARAAIAENAELKAIDPAKEADKIANTKFESAKSQLTAKHQQEITARDERVKTLQSQVEKLLIDSAATAALAEAKGSVDLLLPHVRRFTRVKEDNGEFSVEVIDDKGNVRIGDSKGAPMDIAGLVGEMRSSEVFGRAFEGDGKSGSGKQPGNGGSGTQQPKRSQMTPEQKREFQQKHGQKAFLELPAK